MQAQFEASKRKTEEGKPEPVLSHYYHKDRTNAIEFAYSQYFVDRAGDCKQGYRTIDKDALLSLRSRYARRFFIYLSGNADCFHFRESVVRKMFGLETSYKKKFSSLKRRMECVREEFGKLGVDFTWEFRRQGSETLLTIRAKGMEQYHPSVAKEKDAPPREKELSGKIVDFLKQRLKMDDKGINSNKKTFLNYIYYFGEDGLIKFLSQKMKDPKYWQVHNRIGWLIGAVKDEASKAEERGVGNAVKGDIKDNVEITNPLIRKMFEDAQGKINKNKMNSS
jgi:hypothetical protein